MAVKEIGIIVNGATGRIGATQHLSNALVPIRAEGGLPVDGDRIMPRLLLVGRNVERLIDVARNCDVDDWTVDLDGALAASEYSIFFDAAATRQRITTLTKAVAAGKHIYCEKPVAPSVAEGLVLLHSANSRGLKHGAVEDKIYLPGIRKIARLARDGFFGRITGFRLDFGWWIFDGAKKPSQRPSWNYQRIGGGGIISDMYPHWRYVIEEVLGPIRRIVTSSTTAIPDRFDERGIQYAADVDDSSVTLVELANGAIGTIVCSWATRVRLDDVLTLQVDGTDGSAVSGLHRCWVQTQNDTPIIRHINPDIDVGVDYRGHWSEVARSEPHTNPYRAGWEQFLRHVVADKPIGSDLVAGIRDVQFSEACQRSADEGRWVDIEIISR